MGRAVLKAVKTTTGATRLATYDHVQALLFNVPLAAMPGRIHQIVNAIGPRMAGLAAADDAPVELAADMFGGGLPEPDDIEITDAGVAVIPIRGTFTKRASLMGAWSGLVSYEDVTTLVATVAAKPEVKGLVLAIDSPGGAVMGCAECIAALSAIEKPLYVVADGYCASAAYWAGASLADRFYVTPSSLVGSIGVYGVRLDATKADKDAGLAYTFVRSGDRKGDGDPHKPLSANEKDDMQRRIDQAAAEFFEAIAHARPLDVAAIAALEGAAFVGQDAVDHKLADRVGSVADAVAAMTDTLTTQQRRSLGLAATTTEGTMAKGKDEGAGAGGTPGATTEKPVETPAAVVLAPVATAPAPINPADPAFKVAVAAAVADAMKAKADDEADIKALVCGVAKRPDLLAEFLASGMSKAQVEKVLTNIRADESAAVAISAHIRPGASPAAESQAESLHDVFAHYRGCMSGGGRMFGQQGARA